MTEIKLDMFETENLSIGFSQIRLYDMTYHTSKKLSAEQTAVRELAIRKATYIMSRRLKCSRYKFEVIDRKAGVFACRCDNFDGSNPSTYTTYVYNIYPLVEKEEVTNDK